MSEINNVMEEIKYTIADEMAKSLKVMKKKNNDYSGAVDEIQDALTNFRKSVNVGVDPYLGILCRMQDKLMRVEAFLKTGKLSVKDESCIDSITDNLNYIVLGIAVSLLEYPVIKDELFKVHLTITNNAIKYCNTCEAQELIKGIFLHPKGVLRQLQFTLVKLSKCRMEKDPVLTKMYSYEYLVLSAYLLMLLDTKES